MTSYVADFETTTDPSNCYVWGFGIREVSFFDNPTESIFGTNIDDFFAWCEKTGNNRVYFHNLKFDGQFIISWLFNNGFKHVLSNERATKTFTTLISDKGLYYAIEVIFKLKNKQVNKITFYDSMKLIPLSISAISETFDLPIKKGKIDYDAHNGLPAGSPITEEEKQYIDQDIRIQAHAVKVFHELGYNRITIGSCALHEYKQIITKDYFNRFFPVPRYHDDVKQSYKGGWTYAEPSLAGKNLKHGIVLDRNSQYPYIMRNKLLPYGTPIFFKGQYKYDSLYPLYTQMIRCAFELKPGKLPTIQVKYHGMFKLTEYLTSSNDEELVLCLNSVDLELFFEHYDVYNLEWISGWKFKATTGLFTKYIDKWVEQKIQAKEQNNPGLYLISKLFLNALSGKFGTSNVARSKIPYLDAEGVIHYKDSVPEEKDPVYVAVSSFITSYGRYDVITSAQKIKDNYAKGISKAQFAYADTDSLHIVLNGESIEKFLNSCGLQIHETELGAWKLELEFNKAKFLRQKCYIEQAIITEKKYEKGIAGDDAFLYSKDKNNYYKQKITIAGMPADCYDQVNFKNFEIGATYTGKKQPMLVKGGVILTSVDFTIKKV